ncbi:MAG: hypothetical protein JSS53_09815 [Proteobacteria bacterium]|nr:hypothetical protein [Pseudomonadota bacterium]
MRAKSPSELLLFGVGVVCTISSIYVFLFILYLLPYLFLDIQYDMPGFISYFREWFIHHRNLSGYTLAIALMLPFLLISVLLGVIARLINNYFDQSISKDEPAELTPELRREQELRLKKNLSFPVLLLLLVALAVFGLYFVHYLIST